MLYYLAWRAVPLATYLQVTSLNLHPHKKIKLIYSQSSHPLTILRLCHFTDMSALMSKFFKASLRGHLLKKAFPDLTSPLTTFSHSIKTLYPDFYRAHRSSPNETKFSRTGTITSSPRLSHLTQHRA